MSKKTKELATIDLLDSLKQQLARFDPVAFAENHLTIDGKPFNMSNGTGYKYMADVMRSVATQAENRKAKPTVVLKGRQVGATIMAAALSLYFASSGLYGTGIGGRPPIRILHLFPTIPIMSKYTKDKLEPMMRHSQNGFIATKALRADGKHNALSEDTLTEKTFAGDNKIRIDAIGKDADRIRGLTQDGIFFDECFPYDQHIETEDGKIKIGVLHKMWKAGEPLPRVLSYNEANDTFEYKEITNAWSRGKKSLIQLTMGNREIRCTANHRFLTERGWIPASELIPGDLVKTSPGGSQWIHALNDDQYQVVLGSFLGDGGLSSHKRGRYRLRVTHGIKQSKYCAWKADIFGSPTSFLEKNGYAQTPAVRFCSKSFGLKHELPKSKTDCPQWVLDEMDARALAIWFMDDGSVNKDQSAACISTCSFDEDSQKRIVETLKHKFDIDARYSIAKKNYFSIYLAKKGYLRLCEIIQPYIHKNLAYKVKNTGECATYAWDSHFKSYGLTVVDKVSHTGLIKEVFDIEVKDNHNFILTSGRGSKIMGGPCVHNCQDMQEAAVENALRILTAAQYGKPTQGIQMYFGTPKESGSKFWKVWQDSDQRFFHLGCVSCQHKFKLYDYGKDSWKDIWIEGYTVRCPHCGVLQDKRVAIDNGEWIPDRDPSTARYTGFHMNIMIDPRFTREMVEDYDPQINPNRSERAWKNETLGEFYSGGGLPLTMEDIIHNALDVDRGVSRGIRESSNKIYTLGIDWGDKSLDNDADGARGQSYTAMAVLSCDHNGIFTVENAFRLKKNNPSHRIRVVEELFERYRINNAAADYYHGRDIVEHFQVEKEWRSKLLACHNSGTLAKTLSFDPKQTRVTVNKDLMIEEVFGLIRSGRLKFPVKGSSWDQLLWLMQHCASMETKMVMKTDNYIKRYIKGAVPNDGLMAILYALVAYKFIATQGFSVRNSIADEKMFPQPLLAYAPNLRV